MKRLLRENNIDSLGPILGCMDGKNIYAGDLLFANGDMPVIACGTPEGALYFKQRLPDGSLASLSHGGIHHLSWSAVQVPKNDVTGILEQAAATYKERNAVYKDANKRVAATLVALFPDGVVLKTYDDFLRWHNFELIVVKLGRFATSGLTHKDSLRDSIVYNAMLESFITDDTQPVKDAAND